MSGVSEADLAHWQNWVGRSETIEQVLEAESLRRLAAALGEDLDVEQVQPSLAHWAFFLPVVGPDGIGPDGHPKRGGFLPPVSLPRRMFAAAQMQFDGPLRLGAPATRTSTIRDLRHRRGASGELVLVDVEHVLTQEGAARVTERQTLVFREAGERTAPIEPRAFDAPADAEQWTPGPVELFRFSAVTFNSHRIHYDLPYAREEEGYPGLVVHGPFTAARLFGLAARTAGRPAAFAFRALAPLFAGQPILLAGDAVAGVYRAIRCDGVAAMEAKTNL